MKKSKIFLLYSISFFIMSTNISNAIGIYDAGIYKKTNNEAKTYQYEEVTFVTGKPVILKGTLTRTKIDKEKENDTLKKEIEKSKKSTQKNNKQKETSKSDPIPQVTNEVPITYKGTKINEKYTLSGEGITLTRDLTISPVNEYYRGQIVQTEEISKIKETITTSGQTYNLDSNLSEISESIVIDKKPAIDYYAGNSNFYKVYTTGTGNTNTGKKLIIQMDGKSSGYDEFWGSTETKIMNYTITTEQEAATNNNNRSNNTNNNNNNNGNNNTNNNNNTNTVVNGTYTVKTSQNTIKDLIYSENDPKKISFRGGYIITSQNNAAMEYTYDINGITGKGQSENENLPEIQRLFAPVLTDVQGHYAEEAIKIITSMNGFDMAKKVFLPNAPISRDEFARAVVVTSGIYNPNAKKTTSMLKEELFSDMKKSDVNYDYVKKAVDSKIMIGRDDNKFEPKNPLTRAEAVRILTNSLGLESLIPNGKYNTGFEDESQIPPWAFESAYIAQDIGLIEKGGAFRPNESLTKADASELLLRYINYMTGDLKEDYMQRILNY
ncbi:hypothetical protein HMPREF9629_01760 [Peptoanaerobacter stomatis]|uniref:SLH domain-containing protein n=1 Tax=Peptoanaerobacter stomatis TaxID=796937 RepID=G9X004_9FIRM|nr:S-layer homology domain-containing protein [Peptoanaerobacter stomatis]EHL15636.1 hypothetical protein HMPREF9629_01760 [Peptoanaerobacter stomatis]